MGNGNIWLDGPFLLPARCPCRRRLLPARVARGFSPRVLPRACPWVRSQATALFSAGRALPRPRIPWCRSWEPLRESWSRHPCRFLCRLMLGSAGAWRWEAGGICGARLGRRAEPGVVPQLPGPAWSGVGRCELLRLCCTRAHGVGAGLAAKASFQANGGLALGALQPTVRKPQQHPCHMVAAKFQQTTWRSCLRSLQ